MPSRLFSLRVASLLLAIVVVSFSNSAAASKRTNVLAWLKNNSLAPQDGFMVSRVHMIFEDIKRASDSLVHPTQLFIIQSNNLPWAVALEDKNIILTSGAIDVIYSSNDPLDKRDARMAFVLGHELKHVIENDFSHQQAYVNFSQTSVSDLLTTNADRATSRKTLELLADEEGLINASLAGYDTSAIFSGVGGSDNFLEYWVKQTNTLNSNQHHSPKERIDYLKDSYESIDNLVEFFKYGVRLAHFGEHQNARVLLEDFYKVYESKRVLTNRGYVHLQLARAAMSEQLAYRYWFPDLLDTDSGFPVSTTRNFNARMPSQAKEHLNQAVALLSKGLSSSGNDLSARLNLITAYLFLEEYSAARAVMEKIEDWDKQPQLLGLDALIVMQDKRLKNPWNTYSLEKLELLVASPNAAPNLVYNYARVLHEHGRPNQAMRYWSRLADNVSSLPKNYQVMVCRQMRNRAKCAREIDVFAVTQLQWELTIMPGELINSTKARRQTKSWNTKPIKTVSGINAQIYPDGEGNSLLVLDGVVKLVTIKQHGINFVDVLVDKFGLPAQVIETGTEQIWSYGEQWSALVAGNTVREIWIAK